MDTLSRKIVRKKNELSEQEAWQIAREVDSSVIATVSEDGWPYAVNISTLVINETFYFHSSKLGHKHDNFLYNDKCCLTGSLLVNTNEEYSYKSFVVYGRIRLVENYEEKIAACTCLLKKWDNNAVMTDHHIENANWWAIDVEKITGKAYSHIKTNK